MTFRRRVTSALILAIVSVADAYDAMTSHRPHRPAMKPEESLAYVLRQQGHFPSDR